jgi:hypothetical protein
MDKTKRFLDPIIVVDQIRPEDIARTGGAPMEEDE